MVISISQDQYSAQIWNCALQPVLEVEKETNSTFQVLHFADIRDFFSPIKTALIAPTQQQQRHLLTFPQDEIQQQNNIHSSYKIWQCL